MFLQIGEIKLNRAVRPEGVEDDAELQMRKGEPDRYVVQLVCAKMRVTSVRGTTASRSELKVVAAAMNTKPSQVVTVSALNKSGGLLAPYFASMVSEAMANLSELAEEVKMGSIWQSGPAWQFMDVVPEEEMGEDGHGDC